MLKQRGVTNAFLIHLLQSQEMLRNEFNICSIDRRIKRNIDQKTFSS